MKQPKPKIGDIWEVRAPGKRMKRKEIGDIYMRWLGPWPNQKRKPYVSWQRANKGRYSGISVESLLKYGKLISTQVQRHAKQQARWKRLDTA
jgi:hypothetical protein